MRRLGVKAALCGMALWAGAAEAEGLLRIKDCQIVDDHGPIKAMGVNYVNGFWGFAKDGKREAYLPYLDALAEAKIPFIRMGFGPWADGKAGAPSAPQIADFIQNRDRWFERLTTFLDDLKARHIGVVLDVFWNIDPYAIHFGEPRSATSTPGTRTFTFLADTVAELGRRFGSDPGIWMIEFANESDLGVDFPQAPHTRAQIVAQMRGLAAALRANGDSHLVDSGNALPRPDAEHLDASRQWKPDSQADFLRALDGETPVDVGSVHVYPEKATDRPWDGGDILDALPVMVQHAARSCKPVFVGEFGTTDAAQVEDYIRRVGASGIQLSAIWGFGRGSGDAFSIEVDQKGKNLLSAIGVATH